MKSTKRSLLTSLVALLVLFSMFVGTTFAWFTDIAVSSGNVIQAGKLDIVLVKGTHTNNGWNWEDTDGKAIFNYDKWEPGYTTYAALGIENVGNLAAKVTAKISLNGTPTILGDVIEVYAATDFDAFDPSARPDFTDTNAWVSLGTMADILNGRSAVLPERLLEPNTRARMIIALHMKEDAGNEYQGIDLGANFDITVMATQASFESDSFDDQYDVDSEWPYVAVKFHAPKSVADNLVVDPASNKTTLAAPVTLGDANGIKAEINENVELEPGVETLTLKVESMETPTQDIDLQPGEVARSIDVHVDGVKEGNTTPMLITLPELFSPGLNTTSVRIIHVENGQPVEMTLVANPTNHNEFSYDSSTGDVVVAMASFSEVTPVEDNWNRWEGNFEIGWYNKYATEKINGVDTKVYTINTPDELAGFGMLVDGGYKKPNGEESTCDPVDFAGTVVRLGNNIDLYGVDANGNRISFNPIGFSYSYKGGQVFRGTFDGNDKTISNLYQNGWDLGLSYSMAGGGFFASVEDAIIQDVTFKNAHIVMECIEQGVVAGLAAGNCTFENINIYGCSVANYQRATGGVVGEVNPHRDANGIVKEVVTHNFKDIHIDSDTVIGSLWGDFDAPVGGVIGAKWDDDVNITEDGVTKGVTQVYMEDVVVDCRLDVYNDVTSTYQWYAYRRAGMLIGNTEEVDTDGRTAKADFLTCKNVTVHYGTWTDYHYCEFSDYNPSWPFVRVEAGENCTAFSNPRWGVPELNGVKVTPENHPITEQTTHANGDDCMVKLPFNQLYGGGQGVYGNPDHDGVVVDENKYQYTISYVNNGKVLDVKYVTAEEAKSAVSTENSTAQDLALESMKALVGRDDFEFDYWMYSGSGKADTIEAGHTGNVTLYPSFKDLYTATFVDQSGNVLGWTTFTADPSGYTTVANKAASIVPPSIGEDMKFNGQWEVRYVKNNTTTKKELTEFNNTFKDIEVDITLYPIYVYDGDVSLIPVDTNGDGVTNYYQVAGYSNGTGSTIVEIPNEVNGIPVTTVNANAFSSYDDLHSVRIPANVTEINSRSFTANNGTGRDTVTLYLELDPENPNKWMEAFENYASGDRNGILRQDWDYYMGDGSRVFFLDENGKVDDSVGYWELYVRKVFGVVIGSYKWIYHDHAYSHTSQCTAHDTSGGVTNYTGNCTCDHCKEVSNSSNGQIRPDAEYWTPVATTEE